MKPHYILTARGPLLVGVKKSATEAAQAVQKRSLLEQRHAEEEQMEKHQVRARLVERGSSYRQWAIVNNYQPRTVTQAVSRWETDLALPDITLRNMPQKKGCRLRYLKRSSLEEPA